MESSDDEGEILVQAVGNYRFVDHKYEPISFSVLPIRWSEAEKPEFTEKEVFLDGFTDDGNQKIYKQVTAWKFEMLDKYPQVSVLSKDDNNWIRLLQPRKSFMDTTRTVLITLHFLHFARKFPEASGGFLWDKLWKVFSSYETRPREKDLMDHLPLIRDAIKQDDTLSKSQLLAAFLDNPAKREGREEDAHAASDVSESNFMVKDNEDFDVVSDGECESDEENDLFDTVCAFCDNGGELLCCEGRCVRSFHATKDDGVDSHCRSLCFSATQVKTMQTFMCPNCEHKMHQCFVCRKLGSSDKSSGAEVFQCVTATCGYFYHPECVARLLHPEDEAEADEEKKRISAGESFACPAHKCCVCKQGEDKDFLELQFAVCRRCPKSYHRKCLPRTIVIDDPEDEDEEVLTRAWPNILPCNRILIYCLSHKIDKFLKTPVRDHIIFPPLEDKKTKLEQLVAKKRAAVERRSIYTNDWVSERSVKAPKYDLSHDVKHSLKEKNSSEKPRMLASKVSTESLENSVSIDKRGVSLGKESLKPKDKKVNSRQYEGISKCAPSPKEETTYQLDFEAKNRIITMMRKTESLITVEEIRNGHKAPLTCSNSLKAVVEKTTLGKVEHLVEAVRTAVHKLDAGGSPEDAKAVCGPQNISQIIGWKKKLSVYLAPFLHGNRYTSFGRHFTKLNKLQEIVDKLHWYTQNGDTIVDFCCGANDFSWLMKDKLEETEKRCHFRNFDIIYPKNDFCFEKRDWMTVGKKELPVGDNLIMGLNPPFGHKASLANQFIDKALEFKPKLLILIVPPETERLDRKKCKYDLIWEDKDRLAGKAFYFPGSVDVNDNQIEQWNNVAPPLSLWSRSDWTKRHKKIAMNQGHLSKDENSNQGRTSDISYNPRQLQPGPSASDYPGRREAAMQPPRHYNVEGPCQFQPDTSAASKVSDWSYPGRKDTTMQPPQHYKRRNKIPAQNQNPGFSGNPPSFSSSTSNQFPGQSPDFGGRSSFSFSTSNQLLGQIPGFGGRPSFSSYTSNQVPGQDVGLSYTQYGSAPPPGPIWNSQNQAVQYGPQSYPSMSAFAPRPPYP